MVAAGGGDGVLLSLCSQVSREAQLAHVRYEIAGRC